MKTLGKLKLNQLRKAELEKREMNVLKGGCSCKNRCVCSGSGDFLLEMTMQEIARCLHINTTPDRT
jgi:natural product precursor